jgi:hypothetical protein
MKTIRIVTLLAAAALIMAGAVGDRTSARAVAPDIQQLESPAGPGAAESNLTVGPDGKVYLSWMEPAPDSAMALRFSSFDGTRWSAPQTIRSGRDFFVNWADFPSLAVQANGRMAAHWLQRQGTGSSYAYDVRIAQSADGGKTWGTPFAPHADRSATEKGFVTMWRDGNGFGAAWLDGRKADKAGKNPVQEMMLFATTIGATGAANETQLDGRACDCCQTTAAVTSNGPIVAYRDRSANEIRDIYVTRRLGSAWSEPKAVFADNWEINACPVNGPSVDAAGRRVALAWYTGARDVPRVKVAFSSDAGATFGAPIIVDEGKPAGRVAAVLLKDGSALVSWIERTGGDTASVRVRRVREKEGAGPAATVAASSAARASGFPRMALAGDRVFFAWTVPGRPSSVRVARASAADFR